MNTLLSLILWLSLTSAQNAPRLISEDGNLIIKAALNKNVTLETNGGDSYINIGHDNLVHLLITVKNVTRNMRRLEEYTLVTEESVMRKIDDKLGGKNGIIKRLSNLETGIISNVTYILQRDQTRDSRTRIERRLLQIETRVTRLTNLLDKNECNSNPCKNGANCIDNFNGYFCQCHQGWEGKDCMTDINECSRYQGMSLGCQNGATCQNTPGEFTCHCAQGWFGLHCTLRTVACTSGSREICGNGICVQQVNGIKCICEPGWKSKGEDPACIIDIDECQSNKPPCSVSPSVPCINVPGSFVCGSCPSGYSGNGFYCSDIDECLDNNGGCSTSPTVQCINTMGSRVCGHCPPGYAGDGVSCTLKDICETNNGGCNEFARCTASQMISPTYVRCVCNPGYTGNGFGPNGCIHDVPGSAVGPTSIHFCNPNPCVNGVCHDSSLGFRCTCFARYTGTNCDHLMEPCNPNPCKNGGTCIVDKLTMGFRCECTSQYNGNKCQNTIRVCGGVLEAEEGSVIYPPTNATNYIPDSGCAWVIKTVPEKVLNITFSKFHLEGSGYECTYDWLQIHDGRNTAGHMLGRYCGTDLPNGGNIVSSQNYLYMWFRSDRTINRPGFAMHWVSSDPICGGIFTNTSHGAIGSPGSPGLYPKNRDCLWKITASPGKRILLHFFTLQIETHPNCDYDTLTIYDGDTVDSLVLAKYCNTTHPPFLTTSGNEAYIVFHSDAIGNDYGFQMTYSVVEGIPGCGGLYTQTKGEFSSPSVDDKYSTNILCEYKIQLPPDSRVKISMLKFQLEESSSCNYDYLEIYDGGSTDSKLVGKYCGSTAPPPYVSSTNVLLVVFRSDWSINTGGFKIQYDIVCHNVYTESSGIIKSPGYPKTYPSERVCSFLISLPVKKVIKLTFGQFDIEEKFNSKCTFDNLKIYDGDSENSMLLGKFCGDKSPPDIVSSFNHLYLQFNTDESITGLGFLINYTSIDLECGGLLNSINGVIEYPDSTETKEQYKNDLFCKWILSAPPGYNIQLNWISFDLEFLTHCFGDYIEIWDNNTETHLSEKIGRYCGKSKPPSMTSITNMVTIVFKTDETYVADGFAMSYLFIDSRTACGGNFMSSFGYITSPGWPNKYSSEKNCKWTIRVKSGNQILVNITSFDLEASHVCEADYLEIKNGDFPNASVIGKYCGIEIPNIIPSMSNSLGINFHSDISNVAGGFQLYWSSTTSDCGGVLDGMSGALISPNYPQPYDRNMECYWRISTSFGSVIKFDIIDLDLENESSCNFDYVEIFNSIDMEKNSIGRFCSPEGTNSKQIFTISNHAYIKFRSDVFTEGRGFLITFKTHCNVNFTGFNGAIESPNFPSAYINNITCNWRIHVPKGNKINITFSHYNMEPPIHDKLANDNETMSDFNKDGDNCYNDKVQIIDGSSETKFHNIYNYCGSAIPPLYTSTKNETIVRFESKELAQYSGFRLEWRLYGCGGILNRPEGDLISPGYPRNHAYDIECNWIIESQPGTSIQLDIEVLESLIGEKCVDYTLKIYNGPDSNSPIIFEACTNRKENHIVTSSANFLFIKFDADADGKRFKAKYTSKTASCGGVFSGVSGFIHTPNYPMNYEININCYWYITVPKNHRVNLTFIDFDIVSTNCNDLVKIYDGLKPENNSLIVEFCGNSSVLNTSTISFTNSMVVEFVTTSHYAAKGFKSNYAMTCGMRIVVDSDGIISPHFGIMSIPEVGECTWTLIGRETGDRISLTMTHLDISDKSEGKTVCSSQYVQIFNGESTTAPSIGKYCGTRTPPTIVSGGNALTISMSSINFFRGFFTASYSVLETACGGQLISEHGTFTSPSYPKSYPLNTDCVWTLATSPGNEVSLTFTTFDLEESDNCNEDYVEIREESAVGKILGFYCGNTISVNSGNILWVKFHSDNVGTAAGFVADYSFVHSVELEGDSGNVTSPLYPKRYVQSANFNWRIRTDVGRKLRITFNEFEIDSDTDDCTNYLSVYDGYDEKSIELIRTCGITMPSSVETTTHMAFIKMNNQMIRFGSVFSLQWNTVIESDDPKINMNCGSSTIMHISNTTTIQSPGYPNGYESNMLCTWLFETDPHHHLTVKFIKISLEEEATCYMDKISIYSGTNDANNWKKIGDYCLKNSTFEIINTINNQIKIEFIADSSINGSGFEAQIYPSCGSEMIDPSGIIGTVYPERLGSQIRYSILTPYTCEWKVKVKPGRKIKVEFIKLHLNFIESSNYIMLKNGMSSDSPILGLGKYSGNTVPVDTLTTSENYLYVKFFLSVTLPFGFDKNYFELKYSQVGYECGGEIHFFAAANKTISSPNYPNIPHPHTECEWVVVAPAGETIRINFINRFDLAKTDECQEEYVEIRDGGTQYSDQLGRFCGDTIPTSIKSSGNAMYIKFFTDVSDPKNGFKAQLLLNSCGRRIYDPSGVITSPSYMEVLSAGAMIECVWTLIAKKGFEYKITVENINLPKFENSCINGSLDIIFRLTDNRDFSPVEKCGVRKYSDYYIASRIIIINFTATREMLKVSSNGFRLSYIYQEVGCGGTMTNSNGLLLGPVYTKPNGFEKYCEWKISVPKGRRITLEVIEGYTPNNDLNKLRIYNNFFRTSEVIFTPNSEGTTIVESSENKMAVSFWAKYQNGYVNFRAKYTSNYPSMCGNPELGNEGSLLPPTENISNYYCEYFYNNLNSSTTLVVTISDFRNQFENESINMKSNMMIRGHKYSRFIYKTIATPITISLNGEISIEILKRGELSYKIDYKTLGCGGPLNNIDTTILPLPADVDGPVDCLWHVTKNIGEIIKIDPQNLIFTAKNCDIEYLIVKPTLLITSTEEYRFCYNEKPTIRLNEINNTMFLNYHSDTYYNTTHIDLQITSESFVCGGVLYKTFQFSSPNFPKSYEVNSECLWEIKTDRGYRIKLEFIDRFFIEKADNCSKDFVEVIDVEDDIKKPLAKLCGRELPKTYTSTSNTMFILLSSDSSVTGDGFKVKWSKVCGATLMASRTPKLLYSPGYPRYGRNLSCEYIIKAPITNKIRVEFLEFFLERGIPTGRCQFDNVTIEPYITEDMLDWIHAFEPKIYCGKIKPEPAIIEHGLKVTFKSDEFVELSGFVLEYSIDVCGHYINTSQEITSPLPKQLPFRVNCVWNITAPEGKAIFIKFRKFSIYYVTGCDAVRAYEGQEISPENLLLSLCGDLSKTPPTVRSKGNKMLLIMDENLIYDNEFFVADIIFVKGESSGCGGTLHVNQTNRINLSLRQYESFLLCDWLIKAPKDNTIKIIFSKFNIAPCSNITNQTAMGRNQCFCDYLEIRDGIGHHSPLVGRYCGYKLPQDISSSGSDLWIRFVSDGTETSTGFESSISSSISVCGNSTVNAEMIPKILIPPRDTDGNLLKGIRCTWRFSPVNEYSIEDVLHIQILKIDLESPNSYYHCDKDRLEISRTTNTIKYTGNSLTIENTNIIEYNRLGHNALSRLTYCGQISNLDIYNSEEPLFVTLITSPDIDTSHTGFKLEYSINNCSRRHNTNYGRILINKIPDKVNECIRIIEVEKNYTISLYFNDIINYDDVIYITIKDGERVSSPTLLTINGGTEIKALPIFSSSNFMRIEIRNTKNGVHHLDATYTSSDKGKGCGGKIVNIVGIIYSPLYPIPYKGPTPCEWEIESPHESFVTIKFKFFDIRASSSICDTDYVEIQDRDGNVLTKHCPGDNPADLRGSSNSVKIIHHASENNGGVGWIIEFSSKTYYLELENDDSD